MLLIVCLSCWYKKKMKRKVSLYKNAHEYDYVGVNKAGIDGSGAFKRPLDSDDLWNNPMYGSAEDSPEDSTEKEVYTEVKNAMYEDTSGSELAFGKLAEKSPGNMAAVDLDHTYETPAAYLQPINSQTLHDKDQDYGTSLTAENPLYALT